MKNVLFILISISLVYSFTKTNEKQRNDNFKSGEFIKYKVHHNLIPVNAGFATLSVKEENYKGKPHYHVIGKGSTSGAARAFYKVDDRYESYIEKKTKKPSKFIRKVNEGGHIKDRVLTFNHNKKRVKINDKKAKKVSFERYSANNIQDLISAFYYLRNFETDDLKIGDFIRINIFLDQETFEFKLKILGREIRKTKFGKIACLKIRPYVKSGRIFEESESVTMWVTDDKNHIPVKIKAKLAIGSLNADIHEYKNVKYPIDFKK